MDGQFKLTIMVPALNEESCISDTLREVCLALDHSYPESIVLAIDDGSTDKTGQLMDEAAKFDPRIKVIHHEKPMGLGEDYWESIQAADGDYLGFIPGDNETTQSSIETIFKAAGSADIISPYTVNTEVRGWKRRIISRSYVMINNLLFGYRLKYYNGPCLIRLALLRGLDKPTASFAYMSEVMIQLLDRKASIKEVEMFLQPRLSGKTKAFKFKNIYGVVSTVLDMFWKLRVKGKKDDQKTVHEQV